MSDVSPDTYFRYLERVVLPLHIEHMRARSAATNIFILVEGAAFGLGGTLLPARFEFVNLAVPLFAIIAAVSLLLWDARNRFMIGACLRIGSDIEGNVLHIDQGRSLLSLNQKSLRDSRWPTSRGLVSHTWAIRLLAFGAIVFWSIFLLQLSV